MRSPIFYYMKRAGNIQIIEAEDNFKKVHLSVIKNKNIDCLTLGVYVRILTLGKDWNLNIKGLSSILDISDAKVRKAISLLETEGFITRHAVKNEHGKFIGYDYKLYAEPLPEEERTQAGKRSGIETDYPENGVPQKRTTLNLDYPETPLPNIYRPKETIDNNISIDSINNSRTKSSLSENNSDDDIDYDKVKLCFNQIMDESHAIIPRIIGKIEGQRKAFLRARCREYGKDAVFAVFKKAAKSNFLNGGGPNGWKADFTWMMRPNNFPKVLEGNYDNTESVKREVERTVEKFDRRRGIPYNPNRKGRNEF